MSDFFRNYPTGFYNIDKVKPVRGTFSTNILTRIKAKPEIFKNVFTYYPYRVEEFERPDTLASKYYGSSDFTFLIFLANDITDPMYEWPLFGDDFENLIIEKYGSVADARIGIHHYEKILRAEVPASADQSKVLEKVAIIDKETYDDTAEASRKIIYNYDYEVIENNKKKNIVLIEDIYAKQILNELRNFYG
tara:strand:- start:339 stop:914 length:576 start_codon:yes stop_codon:yes gene_type:complete